MDTILHGLRSAFEYGLAPFDALPPFWGLTLISLLSGVAMLWVVGRTTPQRRIEVARARMASAIYELRLFLDSPRRIFAAQGRLLLWSFAYVAYMLPAFLLLSLPLGILFLQLEARHGQAPLPLNTPIVVKISLDADRAGALAGDLLMEPPAGVRVTAPPLRVLDERLVYARVVITEPGTHDLVVRAAGTPVSKRLSADPGAIQVAPERTRGAGLLVSYGNEAPLPRAAGIASISVPHPAMPDSRLGVPMPWWLYWLLVATVAALALRRPMGVEL